MLVIFIVIVWFAEVLKWRLILNISYFTVINNVLVGNLPVKSHFYINIIQIT
jgi:hypothetical protein